VNGAPDRRHALAKTSCSMLTAKFREALPSTTDTEEINQLLCKMLCHNLCVLIQSMYELGIEPEF
jgi:hypothetical protein